MNPFQSFFLEALGFSNRREPNFSLSLAIAILRFIRFSSTTTSLFFIYFFPNLTKEAAYASFALSTENSLFS